MDALPKFGKLRSTKTRAVGHAAYPKPVATVSQSPAFSSTIGGWRVNGVARRVTGFLICGFASWRRRRWSWRGIRGASHVRSGGEVLADLRHALDREGLQAYIVPTEEPHLSEIPPPCFARRKFLSGFTGSAGTCVVTEREALLWTDGRYFTQAELELSDSWQLMKSGLRGTPKLEDWLAAHLREGDCVGIDPSVHSACAAGDLKTRLGQMGIQLRPLDKNLVDGVWHDRPPMPQGELRLHPLELAGQSVEDKLHRVRSELRAQAAEVLAVTALDEVAYLFNIRGCDVERTPVALAYALVGLSSAAIFVDKGKLPPEVVAHLEAAGVEAYDYQQFVPALKASGQRVWMDTKRSNYSLLLAVGLDGPKVTLPSPISSMKVCKNTCEVDGIIAAHRRDGAAMCGALAQLQNMVTGGQTLTEVDVDLAVTEARAAQEGYVDNSFDTIAGYAANGAIVHYVAQAESAATVGMDSFLLLDSGAQYVDGTTDVTRTLHFGTPTSEERELFTRVLKAHIGLATAIFPTDLPCFALDAFARQPLWAAGLDYRHGTGHGVGAALGVHEFPPYLGQRWESRDALKAGMIVSNEPGVYLEGRFGIRIENLMLVVPKEELGSKGSFLGFTPVTLIPIQRNLVEVSLLTDTELTYLNAYQERVRREISPLLAGNEEALAWLRQETEELLRRGAEFIGVG